MNPSQETSPTSSRTSHQFILFILMSSITSLVEYATFALGAFLLFKSFQDDPFSWWLIDYPLESGGLGSFLSFATSYIIAQLFNFIIQRKTTFKANNHVVKSAVLYTLMVVGIYVLQLLLPPLILDDLIGWFGYEIGSIIVKSLMMTMAMLIQFPLNKWVIMKHQ